MAPRWLKVLAGRQLSEGEMREAREHGLHEKKKKNYFGFNRTLTSVIVSGSGFVKTIAVYEYIDNCES